MLSSWMSLPSVPFPLFMLIMISASCCDIISAFTAVTCKLAMMASVSTGSMVLSCCPSLAKGVSAPPGVITKSRSPIRPSEPIATSQSVLMNLRTDFFSNKSTFTVVSFTMSMLPTVPTFMPEKRILFPTCNPLTLEKVEVTLKTGSNKCFCLPIIYMASTKRAKPPRINKPKRTLFVVVCMSI